MRKTIPVNLPKPSADSKQNASDNALSPDKIRTQTRAGAILPTSDNTPLPVALPLSDVPAEIVASGLLVPVVPAGIAKPAGKSPPADMLDVEIKDKKQLQAVYMPFLTNGGLFLPTAKDYVLGEELQLNLHLLKESRQYVAIGRVAWITPRNALNKRIQGIGVHFSLDENTGITKRKIEELLGPAVKSDKSTHTL
jgi:type IV pilus assembly protein PilZ